MAKKTNHGNDTFHIYCDYKEDDQRSYKGFSVHVARKKKPLVVINSGDPVKDWQDIGKWVDARKPLNCVLSSSVDHFVMDGDEFGWDTAGNVIRLQDFKVLRCKEALPCPFCFKLDYSYYGSSDEKKCITQVHCDNCEAYGPEAKTQKKSIQLWNAVPRPVYVLVEFQQLPVCPKCHSRSCGEFKDKLEEECVED